LVRCVYLTNGASLSGFTLTNGRANSGGGLWCESTNAVASNCVVSSNSSIGGGTYRGIGACCCGSYRTEQTAFAGGVYGGTVNNCILKGNWAANYATPGRSCDLSTCSIAGIFCPSSPCGDQFPGSGGGAANAILNNCTLTGNSAGYGGGAIGCTLNNCTLSGNSAISGFRGHGGGASVSTLNNCTLTGNSAVDGGGAYGCALKNCTLTGNHADEIYIHDGDGNIFPVGGYGGGTFGSTQNNCIVYFNTALQAPNYDSSSTLNYSCTTPPPTNGVGNITNEPSFVDPASGNLRLQSNSPCINAGLNAFAPAGPDPDGNPRIVGGSVDMGAYEFELPPQLAITASGANVIFVWPTNYAGVLIKEDHYEAYFLYSTTNLVPPVAWTMVYPMPVVSDGQLVVTNAIDGTQRFYRIVKETGPLGDVPCLPRGPKPGPCFGCFRSPIPGIWVWAQYANCRL